MDSKQDTPYREYIVAGDRFEIIGVWAPSPYRGSIWEQTEDGNALCITHGDPHFIGKTLPFSMNYQGQFKYLGNKSAKALDFYARIK